MLPDDLTRDGTLSGLSPQDWAWLAANAGEQQFAAGDLIATQGKALAALYVVTAGEVRVEHRDDDGETVVVANLSRGAMLGEMSFVDTSPANVTVVCEGDVTALVIDARVLAQMIDSNLEFGFRFYRSVASTLSKRLRATTGLKQRADRFLWV